jgi:ribulose-phosphate 3-epimerase
VKKLVKVSASILACNSAYIGNAVLEAERANVDIIHIDIMDGHYVKNLTFGPQTVRDLKKITKLPLDVHLEISNTHELIEVFADAGADIITVQLDTCIHPIRVLRTIKNLGKESGIAINPGMGVKQIKYLLKYIDYILLMSVEPGFGGQPFEESTYEKITEVKVILEEAGMNIPIAVDGGVNLDNAPRLIKAGVDILIAGSTIFSQNNIANSVAELKSKHKAPF